MIYAVIRHATLNEQKIDWQRKRWKKGDVDKNKEWVKKTNEKDVVYILYM